MYGRTTRQRESRCSWLYVCVELLLLEIQAQTYLLTDQFNIKSLYCFSENASTSNGGALGNSTKRVPTKVEKDSIKENSASLTLPTVTNDIDLGAEFVVPFSSCSHSLALVLLVLSCQFLACVSKSF